MASVSTLFDVFSANLGLYRKKLSGHFMCPLCLRTFTRDHIHSDLSKAHIIPKFIGGKRWTLACKACNNKVGSEIESCESERAKFNRALSCEGDETTPVRVMVPNGQSAVAGSVQAEMRAQQINGEQSLQLFLQPERSNPAAMEVLTSLHDGTSSAGNREIEVHFRETRSIKRANLTYVHAAYLFMFHQFGYEWALDLCSARIRQQIMSPDEEIILPLAPALSDCRIPDDEMALVLVTKPEGWRRFLVVLPLIRGWKRRQGVWMPLFGCEYDQPPQAKGVSLEVVPVPDQHEFLGTPESRWQGCRFIRDHSS